MSSTATTKRADSGGGPTREPKTLLEALRFLWRRVDEGKDRQRRLTKSERDRLLPEPIKGSGMIGGVAYRRHANGEVDVLNLDWLHAKRWPLFNAGDVSWVQIFRMVRHFAQNAFDRQDQVTIAYLNELQKSGHFELFWRDHMLAGCPHLREELRGQSEAGDKPAGADDGQVDGVVGDPVAVGRTEPETSAAEPASAPPPPTEPERPLPRSRLDAYQSYQRALEANPELKCSTMRKVYKWLQEHDPDPHYELPRFGTWARYIREVREERRGRAANSPPAARDHGSSIVRHDQR